MAVIWLKICCFILIKIVFSQEYAYKDASHYWPLDPILGIEDLVTGDVASIFGDEGVALKGRGNGFMEVKMGSSALMLGEYREKCLVAPEDCKYGITVTKWIRIEKTISSNKSFDLLKMKASDFIDIIRISFNDFESPSLTFSVLLGNYSYNATLPFQLDVWMHASLVLPNSGQVRLFLNGQEKALFQRRISLKRKLVENVAIMIGPWLALHEFGKQPGATVHFDEIAIFYKGLDQRDIEGIILNNFGQIKVEDSCEANKTSLGVKWRLPLDTFNQLSVFLIIATNDEYTVVYTAPKNASTARLSDLRINASYEITIVGKTISGLNVTGTKVIHCSTNLSYKKVKKGGLKVMGIDTDKIQVVWEIAKYMKQHPVAYGVSHQAKGLPAVYKLIFLRTALNHTITDLKPNTEYLVAVTLFTKESGRIAEEKNYAKTKRIIYLPTSPVRNLSISEISWNSAKLHWMPPWNYTEDTIVYEVTYIAKNFEKSYETSKTEIHLSDLLEKTTYTADVKVGAKGIGFYKESIRTRFDTTVRFPAPLGIKASSQWNMAEISWDPIISLESIIYKVEIYSEKNESQITSIKTPKSQLELRHLQQDTLYFFTLRSGNGSSFGHEVSPERIFVTPDHDECVDGSHSCESYEECMNRKSSYECHCRMGYIRIKGFCHRMEIEEPKCPLEISRRIQWSQTQGGHVAHNNCPIGTKGIAHRFCFKINNYMAEWEDVDLSDCVSTWLHDFSYQLRGKQTNSTNLMRSLNNEYSKQNEVVGGDIKEVVTMMGDIVGLMKSDKVKICEKKLKDVAKNLVSLTDNLLSKNTSKTWNDLPEEKRTRSAGIILKNVESMAQLLSSASNGRKLRIESKNAVMEVRPLDKISDFEYMSVANDTKSRISIPPSVATSNDAVYFGSFQSIDVLLGTELSSKTFLHDDGLSYEQKRISNVVAATLFPKSLTSFQKPVVITHELPVTNKSEAPHCVFWNFTSRNRVGSWSTKGCRLHSNNKTHVVCHCYHLTNFAVLMSVTSAPLNMKQTHQRALSLLSQICIGISLAALVVSFLAFCSIRAIKSERNTTHLNLVTALFLAQVLFLFGIDKTVDQLIEASMALSSEYVTNFVSKHSGIDFRTSKTLICRLIAIGLHYLFLVAFTLMGMEGFVLYLMLVKVYKRSRGLSHGKLLLGCWVLPVIIVGITAAVDLKAYANEKYCWINPTRGFIWSFVGPVVFILALNTVIIFLAIKIMKKKCKKRDLITDEIWYWMKCLSMLVTILGLAWVIGLFYINQDSIVMAYVFSVLNASQGLSILIFLCILDQRVQEQCCKVLCCSKRGHYHLNTSQSATKSTAQPRHAKEVNQSSLKDEQRLMEPLHTSNVSMEDQEVILELSAEEINAV